MSHIIFYSMDPISEKDRTAFLSKVVTNERRAPSLVASKEQAIWTDDGLKYRESEEACQETVIVFPSHT